jgi:hypothetical protein
MFSLHATQSSGWDHPAYKYLALSPVGRVTPPGGANVKYPGLARLSQTMARSPCTASANANQMPLSTAPQNV